MSSKVGLGYQTLDQHSTRMPRKLTKVVHDDEDAKKLTKAREIETMRMGTKMKSTYLNPESHKQIVDAFMKGNMIKNVSLV
ncbi:hypothetical protein L1987_73427 [Smallanthus sonchifolius]|uniref:Uncharacterized protein n=1 Tax=Smallanthus sonchifolius TaxID=185202 RepID=A0ACB9A189_9ASTR|nr:hypothetical protein L1987_73427 [Smallanthus sonchifolius]